VEPSCPETSWPGRVVPVPSYRKPSCLEPSCLEPSCLCLEPSCLYSYIVLTFLFFFYNFICYHKNDPGIISVMKSFVMKNSFLTFWIFTFDNVDDFMNAFILTNIFISLALLKLSTLSIHKEHEPKLICQNMTRFAATFRPTSGKPVMDQILVHYRLA